MFAGVIAICVGETVSEMVQVFPIPNATFVYIRYWLGDQDIAWAMGVLYWYVWALIFATEMISGAHLLNYWNPGPVWPGLTFFFWVPCGLVALNLFRVDVSIKNCISLGIQLCSRPLSRGADRVDMPSRSTGG